MPSRNDDRRTLWVFYMAHKFIYDYGIRWLPVNPEDIIDKNPNWRMKYVTELAYETSQTEQHILDHVMRSQDGLSIYDVKADRYDIIINAADSIPPGRVLWTKMHEIGHIYLGHLNENRLTEIVKDELPAEVYHQMEFEADMFAGEVLASKWLMRNLDICDDRDITFICGISDEAARIRYQKATEDYQFTPANVIFTLRQFGEYLKEITICRSRDEIDMAKFVKFNSPARKYPKPKAPFLRKAGECPYCGRSYSEKANFCSHCGSALKKGVLRSTEHCDNIQSPDASYCECCGNQVLRIRQGFCFEECEI